MGPFGSDALSARFVSRAFKVDGRSGPGGVVRRRAGGPDAKSPLARQDNEDDDSHSGVRFAIAMNVSEVQKTPDPKTMMRINQMSLAEKDDLASYEKQALEKVGNSVELINECDTPKSMAEAIRNTEFGKVLGNPGEQGRYVVISYQPKVAGETTTQPQLRLPPLRNMPTMPGGAHYKKMIQAVLASRTPADVDGVGCAIHDGDVFIIGDAGKHGNHQALGAAFANPQGTQIPRTTKTLYAHYAEEDRRPPFSSRPMHILYPMRLCC